MPHGQGGHPSLPPRSPPRGGWAAPGAIPSGMIQAALALLFLLLPLGTTPMEGATILMIAAAVLSPARRHQPLLGPALAIGVVWLLSAGSLAPAPVWAAGLGAWAWVLLVLAPPALAGLSGRQRGAIESLGLAAAGGAGMWALVEVGLAGSPPWVAPVDGPFSHHLTLGYALQPALARALWRRRWGAATAIGVGVACAGASGPLLSAAVLAAASLLRPTVALGAGACVAVGAVLLLAGDPELTERVVLWTAGAEVGLANPHGLGPSGVREATAHAQAALAPAFHFPLHAHDSALQAAAVAGWGAWAALGWALVALWQRTDTGGKAGIAAVAVGGLTQDTLGDLEVTRALCAWAILGFSWGEPAHDPRPAPGGTEPGAPAAVEPPATLEDP